MTAVARPAAPAEAAVDPAVAPPPGNPRFPLFDGLRALAALSVLGFHAAFFAGAFGNAWWGDVAGRLEIGVAVFFAISGFLLYRPYVAAHLHGGASPGAAAFLRRRVLRIVPAYWLALTLLAIYPGLPGVFGSDWWVFYGFGQIYSQETFAQGIPQAWTLCVEVTFYLSLPLYALAVRGLARGRGERGRVAVELALLALLSAACLVLRVVVIGAGPSVLPYTLLGLFDWFAAGMALAVLSAWQGGRAQPAPWAAAIGDRATLCWLGALAVFALLAATIPAPSVATPYGELAFHALNVLSPVVAVLLLLPAVFGGAAASGAAPATDGPDGAVRRFLALPAVAWLGVVSYGIYLWQADLLAWLAGRGVEAFVPLLAVGCAAVVATAAASHYAVERPLLRLKDRRRAG